MSKPHLLILPALALLLSACGGGLSEAQKDHGTGVELQQQGSYEEAIAEYEEAIRHNLQLALTYYNRGVAYANHEQVAELFQASEGDARPIKAFVQVTSSA